MTKSRKGLRLQLDKALSDSLGKQIVFLLILLFITYAVSFGLLLFLSGPELKAFCDDPTNNHKLKWWLLPLYLLIDPNALNTLYFHDVRGRLLIASTLIYIAGTFIFTGMIIGVITNLINRRVENHRNGLTYYLKSGHYVIMGYDEMAPSIIEDILFKDKDANVLILSAYSIEKIRERLKKSVARKQMDQIIVNYGQKTAKEYYDEIHLESAKEIFIVGNRTRSAHDAVNIECIDSVCSYLKEHKSDCMPKRITCVFEDLDTYAAFKTSEIFNEVRDLDMEFVPYNFYAGWARQVFVTRSYKEKTDPARGISYPHLIGGGISPQGDKFAHLVFIGTSNFAVAFAMEAAHLFHFPNFDEKAKQFRTRITFIDQNMEKEAPLFVARNRHFFEVQSIIYRDLDLEKKPDPFANQGKKADFLDVEFEFIRGDVYSEAIQNEIRGWAKDEKQYLSIFVAMLDQRSNFMAGMNLPDEVYDNGIPVFVRQDRADNFVTKLRKADNDAKPYSRVENGELKTIDRKGRYANLYPFGMDDMAYCRDEVSFKRAKLINYLYATADYGNHHFTDTHKLNTLSDDALMKEANNSWKTLTVAKKWSNLYCAYSIPYKLASLRAMRGLKLDDESHDQYPITEEELQQIARTEHNRWNVEELLMGYRKPLPEEDKYNHPQYAKDLKENKKLFIHHDIRPFDDLDDVRMMDYEIARYIPWILKATENNN